MKKFCLSKQIFLFIMLVFIIPTACRVENKKENISASEGKIKGELQITKQSADPYELNNFFDFVYTDYDEQPSIDLPQIKKRGKLIALTGYSPTGYFVYKGTPMGFEHDLLQMFAKELKVELEIVIVNDMNQIIDMLNRGEGDLIADNLTITKERDALVDFTNPLLTTRQVLVQKKPANWRNISVEKTEKSLIRNPIHLIGKTVHVRRESSFYARLKNLSEEIGGDIKIVEEPGDMETEELITMVSEGKIPFTVSDENTAKIHEAYYPNLDIKTPISFEQRIAWAVRENSPLLLNELNEWIYKIKKRSSFNMVYEKYYRDRRGVHEMMTCSKESSCGRNISPYDRLIIKHAKEIGWDWRLLAALIYQESNFNPNAKSWAGACGLMQLMPATAANFGATNLEDPTQSIEAGTKYLKWLEKYWEKKVPNKKERLKFIMASYNVGQEHVADAQRLAGKYNRNPEVWDNNVAYFIVQKSKHKYCTDPVVKYGYCRGTEPFEYVNNILERYEHYKKLIREDIS
ncbi:MAG: transporter substrate-binding domain-containing protein [Cytophagaceae bacterium]|nr:transporter substrate-binding domain-containing protein [Cytophagaceae bacterium]